MPPLRLFYTRKKGKLLHFSLKTLKRHIKTKKYLFAYLVFQKSKILQKNGMSGDMIRAISLESYKNDIKQNVSNSLFQRQ